METLIEKIKPVVTEIMNLSVDVNQNPWNLLRSLNYQDSDARIKLHVLSNNSACIIVVDWVRILLKVVKPVVFEIFHFESRDED